MPSSRQYRLLRFCLSDITFEKEPRLLFSHLRMRHFRKKEAVVDDCHHNEARQRGFYSIGALHYPNSLGSEIGVAPSVIPLIRLAITRSTTVKLPNLS
ncbi:hypothetical protein PoB_002016600 [Plakobranchus ocellatus]|uniref:Uncharacterized protein n=1 Tax=Plakobranchus ocellatus TaxID=259542 RepID=A0AAV3ZCL2_9GAST|nr:hypothetical protein PoB_002016600 [Plakobranchus ocellatus]